MSADTVSPMTEPDFDPETLTVIPGQVPAGTDEPTVPDTEAGATDPPLDPAEVVKQARKRRGIGGMGTIGQRAPQPTTEEKKTAPVTKMSEAKLTKALTELYGSIALMILPFDPTCGNVLLTNAEPCAKSLAVAAQSNASLMRLLIALTQTSAWGGIMIAHLPLILVVTYHHSPSERVREMVAPMASGIAGVDITADRDDSPHWSGGVE